MALRTPNSAVGAGYKVQRQLLPPEALIRVREAIDASPVMQARARTSLRAKNPYSRAFDKVMNLWVDTPQVRSLIEDENLLAQVKAFLDCAAVRLSHDQCLYKLPESDPTPIHADQFYWPVSSEKTVTAWIPLQDTPASAGALAFYRGSHLIEEEDRNYLGRCSPREAEAFFEASPFPLDEPEFQLGDISLHYGWTFHRARNNSTDSTRKVLTVVFMEDGIRLQASRAEHHSVILDNWCPNCKFGEELNSHLNLRFA